MLRGIGWGHRLERCSSCFTLHADLARVYCTIPGPAQALDISLSSTTLCLSLQPRPTILVCTNSPRAVRRTSRTLRLLHTCRYHETILRYVHCCARRRCHPRLHPSISVLPGSLYHDPSRRLAPISCTAVSVKFDPARGTSDTLCFTDAKLAEIGEDASPTPFDIILNEFATPGNVSSRCDSFQECRRRHLGIDGLRTSVRESIKGACVPQRPVTTWRSSVCDSTDTGMIQTCLPSLLGFSQCVLQACVNPNPCSLLLVACGAQCVPPFELFFVVASDGHVIRVASGTFLPFR